VLELCSASNPITVAKLMSRLFGLLIPVFLCALSLDAFAGDKGYDVTYYNAYIHLYRTQDSLAGIVTMQATADSNISQILQMRKYLAVDSIFVNGSAASMTQPDTNGSCFVNIQNPIPKGTQFSVTTYFHGKGEPEDGGGAWGGITDKSGMMFAMGVGFTCTYVSCTRHWLPCYDLPDDKADSVDLTFETPDTDVVASNGLLVSDLLLPNGHRQFHWHVGHPIASYLMTFAVGGFQKLSIPNSLGLPFTIYSFAKDTAAMGLEMRNHVAEALAFFDSLYGSYPFEKVGYVLAPFGSMEHQTMITLDPSAVAAASTTAQHELSHQWWGDHVTCKTFDDAWLNEGFATFSESLVLERFTNEAAYWTRQHSNINGALSAADSVPMFGAPSHVVKDNYPSAIIYNKGAAVLGMLRYYLGDSTFFHSLRTYGTEHAYATATSYDLWQSFEGSTGQDLGWFFREWVFRTGYPQLKLIWSKQGNMATLNYQQTQDSTKVGYFRVPMIVEGILNGVKERVPVWLDSTQFTAAQVQFSFSPDTILTDPDGALIKKILSTTEGVTPASSALSALKIHIDGNPIRDGKLSFDVDRKQSFGALTIQLANESGSIIETLFRDSAFGTHLHFDKNIKGLSSGSYFVMVEDGHGTTTAEKLSLTK
jgi:aminopeptidase N